MHFAENGHCYVVNKTKIEKYIFIYNVSALLLGV